MEVRSLKGIKRALQSHAEGHAPTTALQSSSERSNLWMYHDQRLERRLWIRYIRSRELDTMRKRKSECVGCLSDVSSVEYFIMPERTVRNTANTC